MTRPETDPARMQRRVNDVVLPKNLGPLVARSANQVAKWARDPSDHDADSTGTPGPLEIVRTYFRVLAIHGAEGRACAVELREWLCREADDALGITAAPATTDRRMAALVDAMRESAEAIARCDPANPDFPQVAKEVSEAIAAFQGVLKAFAPTPSLKVG